MPNTLSGPLPESEFAALLDMDVSGSVPVPESTEPEPDPVPVPVPVAVASDPDPLLVWVRVATNVFVDETTVEGPAIRPR